MHSARPVRQKNAAAVRTWDEDLAAEADRKLGVDRATSLLLTCCIGIPETYKADVTPAAAVDDLSEVLELLEVAEPFALRLYISPHGRWRLRIFRLAPVTLSDVLPQLQHMGLEVVDEHPYEFRGATGPFWIYDFGRRGRSSGRGGR